MMESMMTFKEWLATQNMTKLYNSLPKECCEIDFIGDAKLDTAMPDVETYAALYTYMGSINACDEAITGASRAWRRYKRETA
jgi:hypothetical protein